MSEDGSALEFGTSRCVCPKCGTTATHAMRGIPCSETKCPKCNTHMVGEHCESDACGASTRGGT